MAETWSVTPTEGAENLGGGKFKFTPPSSGSKVYTITYDDGKSDPVTTTYTVNAGECVTCDCSKITNFTQSVTSIDANGGNMTLATFKISNAFCNDNNKISFTNNNFVTNLSVEGTGVDKTVKGTVAKNNTAQPRNVTFVVTYNNVSCTSQASFSASQAQGCSCSNISITRTYVPEKVPYNGYTGQWATINSNGCPVGIKGDSVFTISGDKVMADIKKNDFPGAISFSYQLTYNGAPCPGKGETVVQESTCYDCEGTCGIVGEDLYWAPDPEHPGFRICNKDRLAIPVDNFGQRADYTKDRPSGATKDYAPPVNPAYPGKGWWSGPLDGDWSCCKGKDNGIDAKPHPQEHPELGYDPKEFRGITYYHYTQDLCVYEYTSAITASEAASWDDKMTYDITFTTTIGGKTHWIRYEVPTQFRNWIALRPHYSPTRYDDLDAKMTMKYAIAENTSPDLRVGYVTITTSNDDGTEKATVNGNHGNKGKYYTKQGRTYIYQVGTKDMCGCQNDYKRGGIYEGKGFCNYFKDKNYCSPCP